MGGLISGLLVYTFAPEAEGHGTDTVVKAFHRTGGFIRARVAPLKLVASAITIGSGGSAGREGPTALIGAGIGSIYATTLGHRRDEERSLLVLMGMAAGLSAIFRSPIGAAFFAVEVLYGNMEFETGALALHDACLSSRVRRQRIICGLATPVPFPHERDPSPTIALRLVWCAGVC